MMFQILFPLLLLAPLTPKGSVAPVAQAETSDQGQKTPRKSLRERARERRAARTPKAPEVHRADGSLATPGEIPASADPTARSTWAALIDNMSTGGPMRSFELTFDLRQHAPNTTQSNDLTLGFAYLAPRYVSARLESGRTLLRGDRGDFLIDNRETLQLQGREATEDRKQLDQMAAIAASFVALTDPSSLRLVGLQMLAKPPTTIPPRFKKDLKGLVWMRATSPDFFLFTETKSEGTPVYQADLGIDPANKSIRFAVIKETASTPGQAPATILVRMSQHLQRDGFLVPHRIEIYDLDPTAIPPRFHPIPTSRLDLKRKHGQLRARLVPGDFSPRLESSEAGR